MAMVMRARGLRMRWNLGKPFNCSIRVFAASLAGKLLWLVLSQSQFCIRVYMAHVSGEEVRDFLYGL